MIIHLKNVTFREAFIIRPLQYNTVITYMTYIVAIKLQLNSVLAL